MTSALSWHPNICILQFFLSINCTNLYLEFVPKYLPQDNRFFLRGAGKMFQVMSRKRYWEYTAVTRV